MLNCLEASFRECRRVLRKSARLLRRSRNVREDKSLDSDTGSAGTRTHVGMCCSPGSFEHLRVPVARITFLHVAKRRSPDSSRCGYPDRSSSYSSGFVFARDSEGFSPAALSQAVEPCTHQAYQIATAFLPIVVYFLNYPQSFAYALGYLAACAISLPWESLSSARPTEYTFLLDEISGSRFE